MRKNWGMLALVGVSLLAATVAYGQGPTEGRGPRGGRSAEGDQPRGYGGPRDGGEGAERDGPGRGGFGGFARFNPLIMVFDTDKDGTISATEIKAASDILAKMDKDGDGALSAQEVFEGMPRPEGFGPGGFGPGGRGAGGPGGPSPEDVPSVRELMQRLGELDADGDGKIARSEVSPSMTRRFDEFDTDNNDMLESNEMAKMAEAMREQMLQPRGRGGPEGRGREGAGAGGDRLRQLDTNQDGRLGESELQALPAFFRERILEMDSNEDGYVDEEELQRGAERFRERRGPGGPGGGGRGGQGGPGGGRGGQGGR